MSGAPGDYVTCPRCAGRGVIPLSDLQRYEDAGRVGAELRRRLGITATKARKARPAIPSKQEQEAFNRVLEDPELAVAVERITGVDLASATFQRRVQAVQQALAGLARAHATVTASAAAYARV